MFVKIFPQPSRSLRLAAGILFIAWLTAACSLTLASGNSPTAEPTHGALATNQQALGAGSNQSQANEGGDESLPLVPLVSQNCPKDKKGGDTDYYLCIDFSWSGSAPNSSFKVQRDPESSNVIRFMLEKKGSGSKAYEDILSSAEITFIENGTVGPCVITGRETVMVSITDGTCKNEPTGVLHLTIKEDWKEGPISQQCPDWAVPIVIGDTTQPTTHNSGVPFDKSFKLQSGGDIVHENVNYSSFSVYEDSWTVISADDLLLGQTSCRP
jgi:hypothetical protein